jgi:hypothetical protein
MRCYQHPHIPPPLTPPFSQCASKGALVLCLPGEGLGTTVAPQDKPKKSENFCVSVHGNSHISPPAPPHSTTLRVLPSYLIARGGASEM